jgi:hypothetical protein
MITFVKFFQPVEVPTGPTSKSPSLHVSNQHHDIDIDGNWVEIVHRLTGEKVYVTIFNVCYRREDNVEQERASGPKKVGRPRREQD